MHLRCKSLSLLFLVGVLTILQLEALDFELIHDEITCDMLRRAYEGVWYQPQCNNDGSFKNPQCFYPGFLLCCCVNNIAPENKTVSWLGDCARQDEKKPTKLKCDQGTILYN